MSTAVNIVDLVFFGFTFIFVLTAFLRGFVKEVFALLNWIISFTLSYALAPYLGKMFLFYTKSTLIADISARTIIFILCFIIFIFATHGMCKDIKEKINQSFDRSLGVLFGLVKTLLVFGLVYSIIMNMYGFLLGKGKSKADESQLPKWFTEAKSYNIMKVSGSILDPMVKVVFEEVVKNFDRVAPDMIEGVNPDALNNLMDKTVQGSEVSTDLIQSGSEKIEKTIEDKGYNKKDIEKMNRLIEIVQ
jgi:uncharacterized membrane protein required for colicin V production